MVLTVAQQFLRNKGTFEWTADLRREYSDVLKNPNEIRKLQEQVTKFKKPRPMAKILNDLRGHKDLAFILIRVNKETGSTLCTTSAKEQSIVEKLGPAILSIQAEIINASKPVPQNVQVPIQEEYENVYKLRHFITSKAREAYHLAGFEGSLVPWAKIENDYRDKTQKGPGHFVPRIENPHNKSKEFCEQTIAILKNETLTFVAYPRKKVQRKRKTPQVFQWNESSSEMNSTVTTGNVITLLPSGTKNTNSATIDSSLASAVSATLEQGSAQQLSTVPKSSVQGDSRKATERSKKTRRVTKVNQSSASKVAATAQSNLLDYANDVGSNDSGINPLRLTLNGESWTVQSKSAMPANSNYTAQTHDLQQSLPSHSALSSHAGISGKSLEILPLRNRLSLASQVILARSDADFANSNSQCSIDVQQSYQYPLTLFSSQSQQQSYIDESNKRFLRL